MGNAETESLDAGAIAYREKLEGLGLNQSSFAEMMANLGDNRELSTILRSVQRMATGEARVSGEMHVILTLAMREVSRAKRLAEATEWHAYGDQGGITANVQGVDLSIVPQTRGRYSIYARYVAEGPNGYSPPAAHWRHGLKEAKIRAIQAVDETLDSIERIRAERESRV